MRFFLADGSCRSLWLVVHCGERWVGVDWLTRVGNALIISGVVNNIIVRP